MQSLEILQTNALQKRSQKCAEFSENADTFKKKILQKRYVKNIFMVFSNL